MRKRPELMRALADRAAEHAADPMPGFTHLQTAQPVTFGHHLLAYVEMLHRDRGRMADARRRLNECPLGSAALAGTSFPIDRSMTAEALGFDRPTANSLDAVADRDFALEFLAAASICAIHVSRLAEEIVIWCSAPFGFVRLSDAFTTGSSIMPQKRNPDAAELARAKVGRIMGALVALLTVMKGLPLAYAKDTQEDKEPVFDAADALSLSLAADGGNGAGPEGGHGAHAGDGRQRLLDGDGSGRLAGAGAAASVPDGAPRDGAPGDRGRGEVGRSCGTDARRDAGCGTRHHSGSVRRAHGRRLGCVPHQLWRNSAGERHAGSRALAGGAGVRVTLFALAVALALAGCGKKGSPVPPGPQDQITFPRSYPTH